MHLQPHMCEERNTQCGRKNYHICVKETLNVDKKCYCGELLPLLCTTVYAWVSEGTVAKKKMQSLLQNLDEKTTPMIKEKFNVDEKCCYTYYVQ